MNSVLLKAHCNYCECLHNWSKNTASEKEKRKKPSEQQLYFVLRCRTAGVVLDSASKKKKEQCKLRLQASDTV